MGCCKSDNGGTAVRSTLILGAALGLSFLFLILAAAIYHDYLPFLNIAFIVLVPVAVIIGDVMGGSSSYGTSETSVAWANFGHCSFGTIMISMFGLPLVLLHIDAVTTSGFGLWIASTIITFFGATWFWISRRRKEY